MKRHLFLASMLLPGFALAQGADAPPATSPPVSSEVEAGPRARGEPEGGAAFRALDVDSDGKVSPQEATPDSVLSQVFAKADRNADGFVDGGEYRRYEMARNKAAASMPKQ